MIVIGTPHKHNAGYFVNDKDKKTRQEADIQTCPHCQCVIKMQEWAKAPIQNFCMGCMQPTCDSPLCQPCVPFLKKLEMQREAVIKYEQFLKMAGLDPVNPPSIITSGV
jgi:hypothetical protein